MKQLTFIVISLTLLFSICSAGEKLDLKDKKMKLSYSVGYQVGGDFLSQGMHINPDMLLKGVTDAMEGNRPMMTNEEMRATLIYLQNKVVATREKKIREQSDRNLKEGLAFLDENRKKEGVITLPSGLQYKIIAEGSGNQPKDTDTVTVNYLGTLVDGTEFDSSYRRGKPATFRADHVIAGWKEALQLMKEGARWQLFIPPDLAYGKGSAGSIGPNSTLIFEIELISVRSADQ